jgi:hypothetical protein
VGGAAAEQRVDDVLAGSSVLQLLSLLARRLSRPLCDFVLLPKEITHTVNFDLETLKYNYFFYS